MEGKCVVCGEADEGKPLYKKLGSGEYNVEVIVALRLLELTSLPDSAKNNHYICWDCDETIVAEYGRYLENEDKVQTKEMENKEKKRQKRAEQREKKKLEVVEKRKSEKEEKRKNNRVEKPKSSALRISPLRPGGQPELSKTKMLEIQRAKNAYNSSHCLLCDSVFDCPIRGYQRFSLKKIMIDDLDIASVIEHLGLARHIAPEMKSKRFVCANCFFTLRRNYKDKAEKGSTLQDVPADMIVNTLKSSFRRATPDEHAAEIAKLLPPALAECYKIMTSNSFDNQNNKTTSEKAPDGKADADFEEEEGGLRVSQDEHGNFVVNMKFANPSDSDKDKSKESNVVTEKKPESPSTPRKKKNILLPKRHYHHLKDNRDSSSVPALGSPSISKGDENMAQNSEASSGTDAAGTCNICGRTFFGKPADWWHNLNSPLSAFQSITVSMALQLLETSLANTNEKARLACQVCLPCYGMVSSGFRIQIVQRIARQKNIDPSKVNLSKVKFQMMRKEDLSLLSEKKVDKTGKENILKNKTATNDTIMKEDEISSDEAKKLIGSNCQVNAIGADASDKGLGNIGYKRKNSIVTQETEVKKLKVRELSKGLSLGKNQLNDCSNLSKNKVNKSPIKCPNDASKSDSEDRANAKMDVAWNEDSQDMEDYDPYSSDSEPYRDISSDSDFEIVKKKKKHRTKKLSNKTSMKGFRNIGSGISKEINNSLAKGEHNKMSVISKGKKVSVDNRSQKDMNCDKLNNLISNNNVNGHLVDSKIQKSLNVNSSCTLYFALTKLKECKLELKNMRKSLPKAAFSGKSLHVRLIPGTGYQVSLSEDLPSSSLQYILNTMATPDQLLNKKEAESNPNVVIHGRCVVCATKCRECEPFWHSLEEDINPPAIQVPVRWVCASLSIAPVMVTDYDRHQGLVCRHCFINLSKEFDIFVRTKIGESCDIPPAEVEVSEYVVTFNQSTMNIEADPVELTPEDEIEESEKILTKLMPTILNIGLDDLCGEYKRTPLKKEEYTIWLLLVLNEFRVQVGESLQTLVRWLTQLMPLEMRLDGLDLCENKFMPFITSLANKWSISSNNCFEKLNCPIPQDLFVSKEVLQVAGPSKIFPNMEEKASIPDNNEKKKDIRWEDFLSPVNLDKLFKGQANPIPREHFNNGLLYAFWRLLHMIGGEEEQLADWIKQVSPITLEEAHLQMLLNGPVPLHDHLKNHPEDIDKLKCVIIPESVTIKPRTPKSDSKLSESSGMHENSNTEAKIAAQAIKQTKAAGITNSVNRARNRKRNKKKRSTHETAAHPPPSIQSLNKSQISHKKDISLNTLNKSLKPKNRAVDSQKKVGIVKTLDKNIVTPKLCTLNKRSATDTLDSEAVTYNQPKEIRKSNVSGSKQKKKLNDSQNDTSELSGPDNESNGLSESILLANKVKELERQLLAMKHENQQLLIMNQKLYDTTSTEEPDTADKNDGNKSKMNANYVLTTVNKNANKQHVKEHLRSPNEKFRGETSPLKNQLIHQGACKMKSPAAVIPAHPHASNTPQHAFDASDRVILVRAQNEHNIPKTTSTKLSISLNSNLLKETKGPVTDNITSLLSASSSNVKIEGVKCGVPETFHNNVRPSQNLENDNENLSLLVQTNNVSSSSKPEQQIKQ